MINPFVCMIKKLTETSKHAKRNKGMQEYYRIEHIEGYEYYYPRRGR